MGHRLFELVEPIAVVTDAADELTGAVMTLGASTVWDDSAIRVDES